MDDSFQPGDGHSVPINQKLEEPSPADNHKARAKLSLLT